MHCELCEICARKKKIVDSHLQDPYYCSERPKDDKCPGFVPGNIPKKVI